MKLLLRGAILLLIFSVLGNAVIFLLSQQKNVPSPLPIFQPSNVSRVFGKPEKTFGQLLAEIIPTSVQSIVAVPVFRAKSATIALLGDSMIQTMGKADYLKNNLETILPVYNIKIINYGIGSTNIDSGYERLKSILLNHPDILVIESFAYNSTGMSLDHQWEILTKIVEEAKKENIKPIILSSICPNSSVYAKGIEGINFDDYGRKNAVRSVKAFLENAVKFASAAKLPLANAYSISCDGNGEGKLEHIESSSHLHPSDLGHRLVSQKISEAISGLLR